jgi:hypothetical protein
MITEGNKQKKQGHFFLCRLAKSFQKKLCLENLTNSNYTKPLSIRGIQSHPVMELAGQGI